MRTEPIRSISSKHEPIDASNARTYLEIDMAWLEAIRQESKRGAMVSPWLLATVSARIALAEAIIAAQASSKDSTPDLLQEARG